MTLPFDQDMRAYSHRLGAEFDGEGTNFALFSEHAEAVELCLFDEHGTETRGALPSTHTAMCGEPIQAQHSRHRGSGAPNAGGMVKRPTHPVR